eukprot:10349313-Alexandrium_andersonii.AAC.1
MRARGEAKAPTAATGTCPAAWLGRAGPPQKMGGVHRAHPERTTSITCRWPTLGVVLHLLQSCRLPL